MTMIKLNSSSLENQKIPNGPQSHSLFDYMQSLSDSDFRVTSDRNA